MEMVVTIARWNSTTQILAHSRIRVQTRFKSKTNKITEWTLARSLKEIFKNEKITVQAKSNETRSGDSLEVSFPELKLSFRFNDSQNFSQDNYEKGVTLDDSLNYTVITIPYWWDGEEASLIATIRKHRPDLLQDNPSKGKPIPNMPTNYTPNKEVIKGYGELTRAMFYDESTDPTNWMLFEKYDGVRAFWNPIEKKFYSRYGKQLRIPDTIIGAMPTIHLDGELWFGRGRYQEAQKITLVSDINQIDWKSFRYVVFDDPIETKLPYKERYDTLLKHINADHPFIMLAPAVVCKGRAHVTEYSNEITSNGGEGIILRNPNSTLKQGRSKGYLKFKVYRDEEARLIEHVEANIWRCELPNGILFEAPAEDQLLKSHDMKNGDIISFKYTKYHYVTGKPLSAILYRYRDDKTWGEVITSFKEPLAVKKDKTHLTIKRKPSAFPRGYWYDVNNVKKFFEKFAASKGFDPLIADNWYKVSTVELMTLPGASALLRQAYPSLKAALSAAFPSMEIDEILLAKGRGKWMNRDSIKSYFDKFAREKEFDPMVEENWYKSANRIGNNYVRRSLYDLLTLAYPSLNLDPSRLRLTPKSAIDSPRKFFEEFAKKKNFDPLNPNNWYMISAIDFYYLAGYRCVIKKQSKHWVDVLIESFPEVQFDRSRFGSISYWEDISHVREFLDNFAKSNNFDPLVPGNWTKVPHLKFYSTPEGKSLISHFKNVKSALLKAYPELNFPPSSHRVQSKELFRDFFDSFASHHGFDPTNPGNWYSITVRQVRSFPGGNSIHARFPALKNALSFAYPELKLDPSKFRTRPSGINWGDKEILRNFFDNLAKELQFDPLVPDNWYKLSANEVRSRAQGLSIYYGKSFLYKSLRVAYPELNLNKLQMITVGGFSGLSDVSVNFYRFDPTDLSSWKKFTRWK